MYVKLKVYNTATWVQGDIWDARRQSDTKSQYIRCDNNNNPVSKKEQVLREVGPFPYPPHKIKLTTYVYEILQHKGTLSKIYLLTIEFIKLFWCHN